MKQEKDKKNVYSPKEQEKRKKERLQQIHIDNAREQELMRSVKTKSKDTVVSNEDSKSNVADRVQAELYQDGQRVSREDMPEQLKKVLDKIHSREVSKVEAGDRTKEENNLTNLTDEDVAQKEDHMNLTRKLVNNPTPIMTVGSSANSGSMAAGLPTDTGDNSSDIPISFTPTGDNFDKSRATNYKSVTDSSLKSESNEKNDKDLSVPYASSPLDLSNRDALKQALSGNNFKMPSNFALNNNNSQKNAEKEDSPNEDVTDKAEKTSDNENNDHLLLGGISNLNNSRNGNINPNGQSNNRQMQNQQNRNGMNVIIPPRVTPQGASAARQSGGVIQNNRTGMPTSSRFGGGRNINGGTSAKARNAAAQTVKKVMQAKKIITLGPIIASIAGFLLIVLLLVGAVSFLINMPGTVRDKVENVAIEFFQGLKGLIVGQDLPSSTKIKSLAEYLEREGYDLKYNGFVTELEKDSNGNIKKIESKYLTAYLAAEQRGYLIANQNLNVVALFRNAGELLGGDWSKIKDSWGTGMIMLENESITKVMLGKASEMMDSLTNMANSVWNALSGKKTQERPKNSLENLSAVNQRIVIKRETNEMIISKQDLTDLKKLRLGFDTYSYSLKEWTDRYGTPTDLFLSLHLATRAPEFAYEFATKYDTKVYMNIKELSDVNIDVVYAQTDSKGNITLDKDGKPIMQTLAEIGDEKLKSMGLSPDAINEMKNLSGRNIDAFTPYITKVINHWYYKQIIYQGTYKTTDNSGNEVEKAVNVYKEKTLEPNSEGYVRYYLYTRTTNPDEEKIEESTKKLDEESGFGLFGLDKLLRGLVGVIFSGNFSGISGILDFATSEMLNNAYKELSKGIVKLIPSNITGFLSGDLAQSLSNINFFKNGFDPSTLTKLTLGDMKGVLNYDGILNEMKIDSLGIDISKMMDNLNFNDLTELSISLDDIKLDNLDDVFKSGMDDILDFKNINIDSLTNELIDGFDGTIKDIENSILSSSNQIFSGFGEKDVNKVMEGIVDGISGELVNITTGEFLNDFDESLKNVIAGKYNDQILQALKNESSKQLLGMPINKVEKILSNDINSVKKLGTQLTDIDSKLENMSVDMTNLSNTANKVSKELVGVDVAMLKSASTKLQNVTNTTANSLQDLDIVEKAIDTGVQLSEQNSTHLKRLISEQKQLYKKLDEANRSLNTQEIVSIKNAINKKMEEIEAFSNSSYGMDDFESEFLKSQVSKIKKSCSSISDLVDNLDVAPINSAKNRIYQMDMDKFIQLADDFYNIDPLQNGLKDNVTLLNNSLQALESNKFENLVNDMTNYDKLMDNALNRIENHLLSSVSSELKSNYSKIMNTANLVKNSTDDLDLDDVTRIVNSVPGLNCKELTAFSSQINNLFDGSVDGLLNKVENVAKDKLNSVVEQVEQRIIDGVKQGIANNLSDKLKNKLLNDDNFKESMKKGMLTKNNQDSDALSGEEEPEIEDPIVEYLSGFYIREIRKVDYFQVAEPIRVLYNAREHWFKMFRENKYFILDDANIDMKKITDKNYLKEHWKTIWDAMSGDVSGGIYAMLQGIKTSSSEYLLRYFKELFTDNSWVFDANYNFMQSADPSSVKSGTFGWIFKTAEVDEIINTDKNIVQKVLKAEYEPYTWTSNNVGILKPYSEDPVYGFKQDLDIVSPVEGVVVAKTEAGRNELGEEVPASVTIEVRNSGDENADGMRVILIGGNYDYVKEGTAVKKAVFKDSADGEWTEASSEGTGVSEIGRTTDERIRIIVLDKDRTMVSDVSKYVRPPYEINKESVIKNGL